MEKSELLVRGLGLLGHLHVRVSASAHLATSSCIVVAIRLLLLLLLRVGSVLVVLLGGRRGESEWLSELL